MNIELQNILNQMLIQAPEVIWLFGIMIGILCGLIIYQAMSVVVSGIKRIHRRKSETKKAIEQYNSVISSATKLSTQLENLLESEADPLDLIVQFFALTSPVSDDTCFDMTKLGKHITEMQRNTLSGIISVVKSMGRCSCGFNRTTKGQPVTARYIYLGDIYGIFTKTVTYWKSHRNDEDMKTGLHKETYRILQAQARGFMKYNFEALRMVVRAAY